MYVQVLISYMEQTVRALHKQARTVARTTCAAFIPMGWYLLRLLLLLLLLHIMLLWRLLLCLVLLRLL